MMILDENRNALISRLGLSESLLKLTRGKFVHDELEYRCMSLKYSLEPEDFSPTGIDVVPLWESDSSITGFYTKDNMPVFIHYYIEDIEEYRVIGHSVDDLITFLVDEYVEYDKETEVRELLKNQ